MAVATLTTGAVPSSRAVGMPRAVRRLGRIAADQPSEPRAQASSIPSTPTCRPDQGARSRPPFDIQSIVCGRVGDALDQDRHVAIGRAQRGDPAVVLGGIVDQHQEILVPPPDGPAGEVHRAVPAGKGGQVARLRPGSATGCGPARPRRAGSRRTASARRQDGRRSAGRPSHDGRRGSRRCRRGIRGADRETDDRRAVARPFRPSHPRRGASGESAPRFRRGGRSSRPRSIRHWRASRASGAPSTSSAQKGAQKKSPDMRLRWGCASGRDRPGRRGRPRARGRTARCARVPRRTSSRASWPCAASKTTVMPRAVRRWSVGHRSFLDDGGQAWRARRRGGSPRPGPQGARRARASAVMRGGKT